MPHTPGPWHLSESAHQSVKAGICSESGLHITDVNGYGMTDQQNNSNATLIASAPELLEVAKLTLRNINSLIFHTLPTLSNVELQSLERWAEFAEKAIAKAEGRSI